MTASWESSRLLLAARRRPVDRVPVWLMRQAGRYLPEYRRVREKVGFAELCRRADLCAEVMVSTVERLGVDAAILFSDLLLILEAMGLRLEYAPSGPVIHDPIQAPAEVDRLAELEDVGPLDYVLEAVAKTRAGLAAELPLIGFVGAPFTLAAYAVEGGASRHYLRAKGLMYGDEPAFAALLGRLGRAVVRLANAQIDAGAQLVQIFDSWAGCLGAEDYQRHVLPHMAAVIQGIRPGTPVICFATGNPALLPLLSRAGAGRAELVVGVDWRVRLADAWKIVGYDRAVQGNLDPAVLLGPEKEVRRRTREILEQTAGRPGHIFNLGHGVLPQTPVENVLAMIDVVHSFPCRWAEPDATGG